MAVRIPAPPPHRRPTPDHPPYAEMVQRALKTLAEPHGSTESSISTFIQENYTSLPWGHSKLLPYYLNKLLATGEVLRSKSDPNCYVLPGHLRGRGRPRKYSSNSSGEMIVSENAAKKRKGTVLKFKRKCPEGDANANDSGWMLSNNKTHEQEDEALHGTVPVCTEQNNMLLALPAIKSCNTKMIENGCSDKVVELQKKHVQGMEVDMQNENLLALDGKDFGGTKVDVNSEDMTLQEKDHSPMKIDDNHKRISVLQDKNCILNVNAEKGNEKDKDVGHMKIDGIGEKMLALEEKDCSTAKIDGNDKVLVLQDKKRSLSANADNGNDMLALQEKGIMGVEFYKQSDNSLALKENIFGGERTLVSEDNDMKGIEFNMQNENLLPLGEKDSGNMKIDANGEVMLALQEKDTKRGEFNMQNDNAISLKEKDFGDLETNVNSEEMLILQEKDAKEVEFDRQNEILFPLHERSSGDMKIDENDEAAMLASNEKKCCATKVDENKERISVLQDNERSSSVIVDNGNESSLHEGDLNACKNEDEGALSRSLENVEELPHAVPSVEMDTPSKKSGMSPEVNTPSKKSKPKKFKKKLWFES